MVEQLYTIEEVAKLLKVSRKTLYEWMNTGRLPFVLVGERRRITQSALSGFIREGTAGNEDGEVEETQRDINVPGLALAW